MSKQLINDIKRGPIGNSIALHDFAEKEPDVKACLDYVINFYKENDLIPNRIGVTAETYNPKNLTTFERGKKKLEECHYQGVVAISLYALPPNSGTDMLDGLLILELDLEPGRETMVLCFDNQIIPFMREQINKLTTDLSSFFRPDYGYCYQRPFKIGPTWYPLGVGVNIELGSQESQLIAQWSKAYHMPQGKYKTGDLRDIYPMNLLSKAHQQHVVEGLPFFDWIRANAARGELVQLKEDLWAWWVDPDKIPIVREALRPTGWVIAI